MAKPNGNIVQVSNELEFSLDRITAPDVFHLNNLPLTKEVNPVHIVELNVSLKKNIHELNQDLVSLVDRLRTNALELGGNIYGGSSLFEDVTAVNPTRYRTTSLSEACARGLLDITSQQIIIGVTWEEFGISLFNFLQRLNPFLLAFSASSPYRYENGYLHDTGCHSRRIQQYLHLTEHFPAGVRNTPHLRSLDHHAEILQGISDEINYELEQGRIDCNREELFKERPQGAYAPFKTIEPHQVYWAIRLRPDHKNGISDFSIEMRVCDLPMATRTMKAINSFVLGICYYAADKEFSPLFPLVEGEWTTLLITARQGLSTMLSDRSLVSYIPQLTSVAVEGLKHRGYTQEARDIETEFSRIISKGNDAMQIRNHYDSSSSTEHIKQYLIHQLEGKS